MTRRELLENYRDIVIEIKTLERQSAFLKDFLGGPRPVRSVQLTGMPRGTNEPEYAILQRADFDDAIYMLEEKENELRGLLIEFEHIVETIQDSNDRNIIRNYYALGWTDKQIGEALSFDKSTVWKRRKKIIMSLD